MFYYNKKKKKKKKEKEIVTKMTKKKKGKGTKTSLAYTRSPQVMLPVITIEWRATQQTHVTKTKTTT